MVKYKLQLEEDYEFDLIGICSSHTDYRLCWAINKGLGIKLAKGEDFSTHSKKDGENLHSFYEFYDEEEHTEYYLLKNVSNNYKKLIPEKDQIDYFMIIKNNTLREIDDILVSLKSTESISTAFIFDAVELKSRTNLIF